MSDEEYAEKTKKSTVKVGNIYYHYNAPYEACEVTKLHDSYHVDVYWWVSNFESRTLKLKKNSVLKDDNKYYEYFKTPEEALQRAIEVKEEELKELKNMKGL